MKHDNYIKKTLVIGIIGFFLMAGILPNISSNAIIKNRIDTLIFDDFNDNTKNMELWEEYRYGGEWYEQNQRTEFYISSNGNSLQEGIESIFVDVTLSTTTPVIITFDMISQISGNTYAGQLRFRVSDGTNHIMVNYYRPDDTFNYQDSTNPDEWIYFGSRADGTWFNEIEIYSDRYRIEMSDIDSGWIYKSIFPSDTQIQIFALLKLDLPSGSHLTVGFDNIKIEGIYNQPPAAPDRPIGLKNGKIGVKYTYTTTTTDPNGGEVYYKWDWGDETFSDWIGPFDSGTLASASHVWGEGSYDIKVKAKDEYEYESDWSQPLSVTMPRYRSQFRFIENFPLLIRILTLFR
jgi:hypothetical protein